MNTIFIALSSTKTKFPDIKPNPKKAYYQKYCLSIDSFQESSFLISFSQYFKLKNYIEQIVIL